MKLLAPGTEVDGFVVRECIHAGGMAHIYAVAYAQQARDPGFLLDRFDAGPQLLETLRSRGIAENLEAHLLLLGDHFPLDRFVARLVAAS